jgi:hypothetical protein
MSKTCRWLKCSILSARLGYCWCFQNGLRTMHSQCWRWLVMQGCLELHWLALSMKGLAVVYGRQYFCYVIVSAAWWRWHTPAAAAVGVCGGGATPLLQTTFEVRLCHLRQPGSCPGFRCLPPRSRRWRWPAPSATAMGVVGGGATHLCSRRWWLDFATCVHWGPG